jgi:Fic family protein
MITSSESQDRPIIKQGFFSDQVAAYDRVNKHLAESFGSQRSNFPLVQKTPQESLHESSCVSRHASRREGGLVNNIQISISYKYMGVCGRISGLIYGCMWVYMCGGENMINTGTIKITPELLALIAEVDEFKGAWRAFGTLAPERLKALRHVATIESVGSSTRIEGSKLSDREVEKLLARLDIKSFTSRDEQEVVGYAETMETIFQSWQDIPITENHIKQFHRDLLHYRGKDDRHRGEYKKLSNSVAAFDEKGKQIGIVFETASPFDTPRLMTELVSWLKEARELGKLHPLLIIAVFVVVFLEIHPFQDGNGRLSRILTTLLLLQAGYAYVPYSSLESVVESNKENYYLALRQTQKTIRKPATNWQPWLRFFLRALQQQKRNLAAKIEREKIVIAALPELAVKIIDHARQHGRVTMGDMIRITGASRNTLKEHFRNLLKQGHLAQHGRGKGTWYALP